MGVFTTAGLLFAPTQKDDPPCPRATCWTPTIFSYSLQTGHTRLRRAGRPIGQADTQIAAHALASGLVLVTHHTRHFAGIEGLALQDWLQD